MINRLVKSQSAKNGSEKTMVNPEPALGQQNSGVPSSIERNPGYWRGNGICPGSKEANRAAMDPLDLAPGQASQLFLHRRDRH